MSIRDATHHPRCSDFIGVSRDALAAPQLDALRLKCSAAFGSRSDAAQSFISYSLVMQARRVFCVYLGSSNYSHETQSVTVILVLAIGPFHVEWNITKSSTASDSDAIDFVRCAAKVPATGNNRTRSHDFMSLTSGMQANKARIKIVLAFKETR